jgi:hypothetical protein
MGNSFALNADAITIPDTRLCGRGNLFRFRKLVKAGGVFRRMSDSLALTDIGGLAAPQRWWRRQGFRI